MPTTGSAVGDRVLCFLRGALTMRAPFGISGEMTQPCSLLEHLVEFVYDRVANGFEGVSRILR
jgi:hypothetical protein